jgi:hypothetical protein
VDKKFPPNPVIINEEEWENSFMFSFYHLVNIERSQLPGDDYKSILVAFDDENGIGIQSKSIEGHQLKLFMENGKSIHYEEMFLAAKKPSRVVFWAYSDKRGWAERAEIKL